MRHSSRRVLTTIIAAAALAAGLLVSAGGPAGAAVIVVGPGQSIQAAVNAAPPGSVIQVRAGTYRESVEIKKNGITVQGAGQGQTFVLPPASPPTGQAPLCGGFDGPAVNGFCIHGQFDQNFNQLSSVSNVRITGLTVRGFSASGVFYIGAINARTDHVTATNNTEYGIAAFNTSGEVHQNDVVSGSGEAGFYMGDSPAARASVSNITAFNNGFGVFVRHASNGTLQNINSHDNCVGVLFLNEPPGTANWALNTSTVNHNTKACGGGEEGDATSGIGVAIAGADRITVNASTVNNNVPSGPTFASGGIAVFSFDPGNAPDNNNVTNNHAHGNSTDLVWDGTGTGNVFSGNDCSTSQPPGLC